MKNYNDIPPNRKISMPMVYNHAIRVLDRLDRRLSRVSTPARSLKYRYEINHLATSSGNNPSKNGLTTLSLKILSLRGNTRNQKNDQNFQPHKPIPVFDLVVEKADIPHHKKHIGKQNQYRQAV